VVPFQAEVYDYARHHPDAGESTHRSEGAAAVESRHLVPTLCHETPLEGAVGLPFEDPLRLDALPPRGNRRARDELVHLPLLKAFDLAFCRCGPLRSFRRGPCLLDGSWNIRLGCPHGISILREAKRAVPMGDVGKLPLRGKRV